MTFGPQHVLLAIAVGYGVVQQPGQFWTDELARTAVVLVGWELCGVAFRYWRGRMLGREIAPPAPAAFGPHHILLVIGIGYALYQRPSDFWTNELVRICVVLSVWEIASLLFAYWSGRRQPLDPA